MQISICLYLLRWADKRRSKAGPVASSHHRCLTDVGRRKMGSEDHFPSAVSGRGQNCAPPVSKASRRKSLMRLSRLSVGSASLGPAAVSLTAPPCLGPSHCDSGIIIIHQPCPTSASLAHRFNFSPGGVVRLAPSKYSCHACAMWALTQCTLSILLQYNVKYSHSRCCPMGS